MAASPERRITVNRATRQKWHNRTLNNKFGWLTTPTMDECSARAGGACAPSQRASSKRHEVSSSAPRRRSLSSAADARGARRFMPAARGPRSTAATAARRWRARRRSRPRARSQATAGFAFTPDHRRWGEFHAQLSRHAAAGLERDAAASATSRSCWSRAATGRGAAARCRSRRSSPRCATRRECGSRRAIIAGRALHRPLSARRRADRDRCRRCALRVACAGKMR